jgi:hypothetical protein
MAYVNAFNRANGEPLSNYCIFNDCRPKLKTISELLVKGLKILGSGTEFFFEVDKITADNIYFFDLGEERYLSFTSMRYNAIPYLKKTRKPWIKDMNMVGQLRAKLLTKKCDFIVSKEA